MKKEIKFFDNFISQYDKSCKEIAYKIRHTYKVTNIAQNLALFLNLDDELTKKVYLSALFHDLGRFPQWEEYQTFIDSKSFDHGDKSCEILKNNGICDEIILKAVKYHNKYELPKDLTEEERLVCEIVRDADKLDILHYKWKLDDKKHKIKDNIIRCFEKEKLVPNDLVKYPVDGILRQLSFIYDLNFDESKDMVFASDIIDRNIDLIYSSCKDKKVFYIQDLLDTYLAKELGVRKYERIRKKI